MKISLITVCYNSEKTIKDTLESVLQQEYKNYEYLIIDGKSKDNTLNIVKEYEKKFEGRMRIISEKDKGLYDAMNKGINLATGDIIGIINSDDCLIDSRVFSRIINNYTEQTDILYGDLIYVNEDLTQPVRDYISGENKNLYWCPAHPTMYIRKSIFKKIGLYNLNYKTAADFDMMVRLNKANCKFTYLKDYLVLMRVGGTSNGFKGYINDFKDSYNILKNNGVSYPLIKTIKRTMHIIFQYIITYINKKKLKDLLYNKTKR